MNYQNVRCIFVSESQMYFYLGYVCVCTCKHVQSNWYVLFASKLILYRAANLLMPIFPCLSDQIGINYIETGNS